MVEIITPYFQLKELELREAMWPAKGHTGSSVPYLVFLSSALSFPDHAPCGHQTEL